MVVNTILNNYTKELGDKEFQKLSNFIYSNYGIKMPYSKKGMLQARLQNRLRELNHSDFKEYVDYVFSGKDSEVEIIKMIDVVSTNKTDFYREINHFHFLNDHVLPLYQESKDTVTYKVWSSACSSGEEAYTIALALSEFSETNKHFNFSIFGTDISTRILEKAVNAIYPEERINPVPWEQKKKYFLRSKNRENPTVRVIPALRNKTSFMRLNLIDDTYTNIPHDFDLIFCRNVLIYFDRNTQEKVINSLCKHLKPGGYFFLGHSESATGLNVPLKQIKPTIFQKI